MEASEYLSKCEAIRDYILQYGDKEYVNNNLKVEIVSIELEHCNGEKTSLTYYDLTSETKLEGSIGTLYSINHNGLKINSHEMFTDYVTYVYDIIQTNKISESLFEF